MEQVDVVRRAFRILESFVGEIAELSLNDITKKLNMPKTTVYRLIKTLERCGYLDGNEQTRKYRLGSKVFVLAIDFLNQNDLRKISLPIMTRIRDLTGETVYLNLLQGDQRLMIDHVVGTYEIVYVPKLARSAPLYAGASSKVMLAFMNDSSVSQILTKEKLKPFSPRTITDVAELNDDLEKIRNQGYSLSISELEEGLVAVSAPLKNFRGIIGSLSIGFPEIRYKSKDVKALIRLIKEGADGINKILGKKSSKK